LRNDVRELKQKIAAARVGIDQWNEEGKPRLALLKKEINEYEKYFTNYEGGRITDADELAKYDEVKNAWEMAALERMSLEEIEKYTQTVSRGKKKIRENNKVLKAYRKERKTDADSLFTSIDALLEKHRICRAAYHGGDLQGNDVIKLMKCAHELLPEIAQLFIESKDEMCTQSDVEIHQVCNIVKEALTLWNKAFTLCQKHNPSDADCTQTQEHINAAMEATRQLEVSITPKNHGMEDHVVDQMRRIPGGIAHLMEYWVEQYHQTGSKFDRKCKHARTAVDLAEMRVREDTMRNHPEVKNKIDALEAQFKRKFKSEGSSKSNKKAKTSTLSPSSLPSHSPFPP
jgi:hypothetical protein